jgi:general secretion pathway protein C
MFFLDVVKKYLWVIKLVFVAVFAIELALLVNTRIEAKVGAAPIIDLSDVNLSVAGGYVSISEYEQILKKNIFNSAYVYKPRVASGPNFKVNEDYDLIGTVAWRQPYSLAIIQAKRANKIDVYRVGDLIQDEAEVTLIEPRRVTLLRGSKIEILEMPYERIELASRSNLEAGEGGIAKSGDDHFVVDKSVIDTAFSNWGQMMRGARIMPHFDKGKITGFKVSRIRADSLYKKIGLVNGDILHRINGLEFKGPEDAFKMMSELKESKNVSLDISRKSARKTLTYSIR